MRINATFCGRRFKTMLFTASVSVCAEILNILIDKIVAAQFLGEKALASISFFTPMYSIVLFVSAVVMVGSLVCYSIEIGKLNKHRADRFFGQSIILAIGCGLIMAGLFALSRGLVLRNSALDPELFNFVDGFYTWFIWLAFLIPVNNVLQEMVYIDGDTRTCNISYAALLFGNAILSIVFCHYMGIKGIALGTLVSVLLSIATLCTHFLRKSNSLRFVWHFNLRDVRSVVRYSLAEACEFLLFALFSSILNIYFIHNIGFHNLPVLSMIYEIVELSVFFNGIWMAAEPLVNTYRGEENDKGIIRTMQFVNRTAIKEATIATVLLFIAAPAIIHIFHIQSDDLKDSAIFALRACAIGAVPMAITKIFANYHVHEKPILSTLFIFLLMFACPLACIVIAVSFFGGNALWVALGIAPFIAIAIGSAVQVLMYGKKGFPLLLEHLGELRNWYVTDTRLTPENILRFRDRMGRVMTNRKVSVKTRVTVMLLIEELGMAIFQRSEGKAVYVEISLVFRPDHIMLICKDDGKIIDMTDLEQSVTDLRIYLINMFMTVQQDKMYLLTTNYNRHVFRFEY